MAITKNEVRVLSTSDGYDIVFTRPDSKFPHLLWIREPHDDGKCSKRVDGKCRCIRRVEEDEIHDRYKPDYLRSGVLHEGEKIRVYDNYRK